MSDFTFSNEWGRQGWICPKCGAVMSPDTSFCPFCSPKQVFVNGVGTGTDGDYIEVDWTKNISVTKPDEVK